VNGEPAMTFRYGDDEWDDWYMMTPAQRWAESAGLWTFYIEAGGSLDPEPDSQSPFDAAFERRPLSPHGRTGVRVLRRGGV
jgi:hypothetical protein